MILFADDRMIKIMELHLFVNQERENLFLAWQSGAVMAFIPDRIIFTLKFLGRQKLG